MNILKTQNRDMTGRIAVAFCLIAVGLFLADTLFAQEAVGIVEEKKTLFQLFKATGITGLLVLLVSVVGFALVIWRFAKLLEKRLSPEGRGPLWAPGGVRGAEEGGRDQAAVMQRK